MQILGEWQPCPTDVFCRNVARVRMALHGLLKTPQNNLKVFRVRQESHGLQRIALCFLFLCLVACCRMVRSCSLMTLRFGWVDGDGMCVSSGWDCSSFVQGSSLQDQLEQLTEMFKPYLSEPVEENLVDLLARILTEPHSSNGKMGERQPVCSRSAFVQRGEMLYPNGILQ